MHLHDGSLEVPIFISEGRRITLATITKDPTLNMTIRFPFFLMLRLSAHKVGIGIHRIMMSCKMLNPAAIYTTAKTLMHCTGGTLYFQFVQIPRTGIYGGVSIAFLHNCSFLLGGDEWRESTYTLKCKSHEHGDIRGDDEDSNAESYLTKAPAWEDAAEE